MSINAPFIRLAPLPEHLLPFHPSLNDKEDNPSNSAPRPTPQTLFTTLLDQARTILSPTEFNQTFRPQSVKSSTPPQSKVKVKVEILSKTLSSTTLSALPWSSTSCPRPRPELPDDEHWFARRSLHHDKQASWAHFVYGLRDHHSRHEYDFTPSIYDARLVLDYTALLHEQSSSTDPGTVVYTHPTMAVYEMCHDLSAVLAPRCFPVLVATASCGIDDDEIVCVTVPVEIAALEGSFYCSGRNRREGGDARTRRRVVVGAYCAVERVVRRCSERGEGRGGALRVGAGAGASASAGLSWGQDGSVLEEQDEEIEWVMATASDTKGDIPMRIQRMGVPGAIAKDVGLFLEWVGGVSREEMERQKVGVSTARPEGG